MKVNTMKLSKEELTEHDALLKCFELIKPSIMKEIEKEDYMATYNNFREHRRNYLKDRESVKDGARAKILSYFGYELVEKVYRKSK